MRLLRHAFAYVRLRPWSAFVLVFLIWAVAAVRWPLNELVVPWDSKNQFYAFFRFLAETIHEGAIPFWNPYHYGGHPSIADPQSFIFSPLFVIWAFIDPSPALKTFDLVVYAHLLVGGLALCRFGQKRGWTTTACILGASIFMFGGPASSRLNHLGIIIAYSLFPVCLLLLQNMLERPSIRTSVIVGAALSLMILGRAQVPFMMIGILFLYFAHETFSTQDHRLKDRLMSMGGAALVAGLIVAIPLALTFQFAEISNRPDSSIESAFRSSLNPISFLTFLSPNIFGSLSIGPDWGTGFGNSPLTDSTDKSFNYLFCGTFSVIVLLWHFASTDKIAKREDRFFFGMMFFFVLYALGRYTPVYQWLYSYIPGVSKFRRPVDATFMIVLMMAYIIPGILTRYQLKGAPALSVPKALLVAGSLAALVASAMFFTYSINHLGDFLGELTKGALFYLLITMAMVLFFKRFRSAILMLATLLTSGELVVTNTANALNAEPQANYSVLEVETGLASVVLGLIRDDIDQNGRSSAYRPRVEIAGLGGPWQNAAMVFKLEATNGYNPLRIGSYDRLVSPGEVSYKSFRKFTKAFPSYNCTLAQKLGLEYLVVDRPIEDLGRNDKVAHVLSAGPKIWVYRLAGIQPRVSMNAHYRVADFGQFAGQIEYPNTSTTIIDAQPQFESPLLQRGLSSAGAAQIISYETDRIEIDVQPGTTATLTLNDIWYPGWKVYVDGQERRVLKSDVLFRGVRIEPTDRKVVFQYEPLSLDNMKDIATRLFMPKVAK